MCDGSCFQSYHAECVGLLEATVRCFSKNIIWLCLANFREQNNPMRYICAENESTKLDLEIADVTDKIANIMETLSAITPQLSMYQHKESFCSLQGTARHSTPTSSPALCTGSKLENGSLAEPSPELQQRMEEKRFSLFLTNIDGSATEQDVCRMVVQALGVNNTQRVKVLKFVPNWRIHGHHSYVSFKVIMDGCFKNTALQSEKWPAGILFREFFEQPRRTWITLRLKRKKR